MGINELRADLKLTGDQQFKRGLKDVGDSADKAGDSLEGMGKDAGFLDTQLGKLKASHLELIRQFDQTGEPELLKAIRKDSRQIRLYEGLKKSIDETRPAMRDLGAETVQVSRRITELKAEIKQLNIEMDKTGDTALWSEISLKERELVDLKQSVAKLARELAQAGAEAGAGFGLEFASMAGKGMPILIGAVVAAAVAALPAVSAMVSGAILGAAGAGGLIGGIVAAAQDQRVKDAGADFGKSFSAGFKDLGAPFVEPTINALDRLAKKLASVQYGDLGAGVRGLSTSVSTLTTGVEGFIDTMEPGLVDAMRAGEKVLNVFAAELPGFGKDLSTMFTRLDASSDGAAMGMKTMLDVGGDVLVFLGNVIAFWSDAYEKGVQFGAVTTGALEDVFNWLQMVNPAAGILAGWMGDLNNHFEDTAEVASSSKWPRFETNLKEIAGTTAHATDEFERLKRAIDDAFGPVMDLEEANLRYQKSLVELQKELKDGQRTLDVHTEAGQRNMDTVLDNINAIKGIRDATASVPEKVDEANAAYDRQLEALRKNLLMLGYNKDAVNELINKFKGIPAVVTTEIRYPGLLDALAAARELSRLLGSKAAAVAALGRAGVTGDMSSSYVSGRASGGPVMPGQTYVVGENGPEVLQMGSQGGTVYNASQTAAMMSGSSGGGSRPMTISRAPGGGDPSLEGLIDFLWPAFIKRARIDGADVSVFGA